MLGIYRDTVSTIDDVSYFFCFLTGKNIVNQKGLLGFWFAVAWKIEDRGKVVPDTVGHVPREISRAAWFFLDLGGTVSGRVFDSKYYPSPIPRGGLEIILRVKFVIAEEKWRILDRMRDILISNYPTSWRGNG